MAKFYLRVVACLTGFLLLALVVRRGGENGEDRPDYDVILRSETDGKRRVTSPDRAPESLIQEVLKAKLSDAEDSPKHVSGSDPQGPLTLPLLTDLNATKQFWDWPETKTTLDLCGEKDFEAEGPLPSISVVITFHEKENVSNILHTVHSVIQRTPPHILSEILLVDDCSKKDDLGGILDLYAKGVFGGRVRILRSAQHLGLIRARALGISMAKGEVVVAMDSHVEVQPGWIEPMLYEIKRNPKTLAASYLDWMEKKGDLWEYRHGGTLWKSYFDWNFVFGWQMLSRAAIDQRSSQMEPIPSPVIIGTIFAIDREFFNSIGGFDEGMHLWGGENLDLPVRVWLCGGRVVNIPCSRVAHLESPGGRDYRNQARNIIVRNYKRFAEVWLGDYKQYFYMHNPEALDIDAGDLTSRTRLTTLCPRNFSWFLDNVFPELGLPDRDGFAWGQLQNLANAQCLDTKNTYFPGLDTCGTLPKSTQLFFWSQKLNLRFSMHLFNIRQWHTDSSVETGLVQQEYTAQYNTSRGARFIHWKGGPFIHVQSGECLEALTYESVGFRKCDPTGKNIRQLWRFGSYGREYEALGAGRAANEQANKLFKPMRDKWRHLHVDSAIKTPHRHRNTTALRHKPASPTPPTPQAPNKR